MSVSTCAHAYLEQTKPTKAFPDSPPNAVRSEMLDVVRRRHPVTPKALNTSLQQSGLRHNTRISQRLTAYRRSGGSPSSKYTHSGDATQQKDTCIFRSPMRPSRCCVLENTLQHVVKLLFTGWLPTGTSVAIHTIA